MDAERLRLLYEEYRVLWSLNEKQTTLPYNTLPVCATAAVALAVFKANEPGLAGVVLAYGLALVTVALAYMSAMVNRVGIRLVELEVAINHASNAQPPESLKWNSDVVAEGYLRIPGFLAASVLGGILGVAAMVLSVVTGWAGLTGEMKLKPWVASVLLAVPVVTAIAAFATICVTEGTTLVKKRSLLNSSAAEASESRRQSKPA